MGVVRMGTPGIGAVKSLASQNAGEALPLSGSEQTDVFDFVTAQSEYTLTNTVASDVTGDKLIEVTVNGLGYVLGAGYTITGTTLSFVDISRFRAGDRIKATYRVA